MKNKRKEEKMMQKDIDKQLNETKVRCEICGMEFKMIAGAHLKTHGITSDEYREQFPDALLVSGDLMKKYSEVHSGKPSPMKGKYHTEETKQLMRDSSPHLSGKDHPMYGVHRYGEDAPNYGKDAWNKGETKETNDSIKKGAEKLSITKKEFFITEEGQKWLDENKRGKPLSEESKQKMRGTRPNITGEKHPFYGVKGENHPLFGVEPWNKGETKETNEIVKKAGEKHSKSLTVFYATEKGQKWLDDNLRGENSPNYGRQLTEEHLRNILKAVCANPNKKEQYLYWILQLIFPKEYKYVGDGSVIIGGHCPDFININGQKKLIEFYGDYWHKGDDEGNRIFGFKLFGFDTLVIWEHELNDDEIEMTIAKIIEFHNRK